VNQIAVTGKMPYVEAGQRVGLYGGSFNPPHHGHKALAETALKRFQLDQIWWMVTPANPLKDKNTLASLEERMAQSRLLIRHPRIHITGFEAHLRTTISAKTVAFIRKHHPQVHFVWLMGADNLKNFHLWQQWRQLADQIVIGVIDRPGASLTALASPTARALSHFRLNERQALRLAGLPAPKWCFLHTPRLDIASSHLRCSANTTKSA